MLVAPDAARALVSLGQPSAPSQRRAPQRIDGKARALDRKPDVLLVVVVSTATARPSTPCSSWKIYGYVNSARETGQRRYLDLADQLASYHMQRLAGRQVPPWDFDATEADADIKDTAAAAVASSALLELGRLHPDGAAASAWTDPGIGDAGSAVPR
jgi:hypothetical protein